MPYYLAMSWYEREPVSKNAAEIGYVAKLPGIDVMAIYAYAQVLRAEVMKCRERARAVLSFSLDGIDEARITLTQVTSGVYTSSVSDEFEKILPFSLDKTIPHSVPSSIWTGTEKADISLNKTTATPSLNEGRKLIIETLSTPDAHYMELEDWCDAVISEPRVLESGISFDNQIPILATEAKHTSR